MDGGIKMRMVGEVVCRRAPYDSTSYVRVMSAKRARRSGVLDSIPIMTICCCSFGADMSFAFARVPQ